MDRLKTRENGSERTHPKALMRTAEQKSRAGLGRILDVTKYYRGWIACAILILVVGTWFDHVFRPSYPARAVLMVQRAENSPLQAMMGKMNGDRMMAAGNKTNEYLEKYLLYLNSHEFFLTAARSLAATPELQADEEALLRKSFLGKLLGGLVYSRIRDVSSSEARTEDLARSLGTLSSFKKSGVDNLVIEAKSGDYFRAVRLANFLAETAISMITEREMRELSDAQKFIESQLETASTRLDQIDSAVVSFRKSKQFVSVDSGATELVTRISALERHIQGNRLQHEQNQRLIDILSQELKKQENQIFTAGAKSLQSSEIVNELRQKVQTLQYKKMLLQAQGYADESSQMKDVNQEIDQLASRMKELIYREGGDENDAASLFYDKDGMIAKVSSLRRENRYLETSYEILAKNLEKAKKPASELPEAQQKLQTFGRSTQLEFNMVAEMRSRIVQLEVEKVALKSKVRVLESATLAGIPPRLAILPKTFLATALGFLLACMLAVWVEELNERVKSRSELDELGLINVGSIPRKGAEFRGLSAVSAWLRRTNASQSVLASWREEHESPEVMAFKHLRTRVMKMRTETGDAAKVIALLSAKAGEGKSYVTANLALCLAQMEKRILVVDCDLRRSSLGEKLEIESEVGTSTVLTTQASYEDCLVRNLVPGLDVLPSGRYVKRTSELVSGSRFAQIFEDARKKYDYILVDTPPVLPVMDSLVIANLSDALVMVVGYRGTKLTDVGQAVEKLGQVDSRPVFAVLNRVEQAADYIYLATRTENGSGRPKAGLLGKTSVSADKMENGLDVSADIHRFKQSLRKQETSPTPEV